ncbi:hypothetical protein DICVIV_12095 [Dictyocaulus viviparus]|uniref:Uncharacterized protein n=1 Tax=Dictyocaulus viviparus TaxID=29172 RepID=A0A0D8XDR5_DICVI|nr:hypothetical protein DICVIV_12095 [Dictyocaulus viviparus]
MLNGSWARVKYIGPNDLFPLHKRTIDGCTSTVRHIRSILRLDFCEKQYLNICRAVSFEK